jgi:A/G-specific adenine glycosylase
MTTASFSVRVLNWFDAHGRRDLPWQHPPMPYRVWISEIMLQQTQVATVIPYFQRFMARFPSIERLANADLDEVLQYWAGLGYYARARNLHACARIIRTQYNGEFPGDIEALQHLPGIGRSTAGAILALTGNQRQALLDGNVKRLLARHLAIEGWPGATQVANRLWRAAEALTPTQRVAHYTQAMMDLGATVCTRRNPRCYECPVRTDCEARSTGRQHQLPGVRPRKALPVRETMMIMVATQTGEVLLERRPPIGVWGGLLCFPQVCDESESRAWCERTLGQTSRKTERWSRVRHTFTHFHLDITPLKVSIERRLEDVSEDDCWLWYNDLAPRGGLPAPVKQLIKRLHKGAIDDPHRAVREAE